MLEFKYFAGRNAKMRISQVLDVINTDCFGEALAKTKYHIKDHSIMNRDWFKNRFYHWAFSKGLKPVRSRILGYPPGYLYQITADDVEHHILGIDKADQTFWDCWHIFKTGKWENQLTKDDFSIHFKTHREIK